MKTIAAALQTHLDGDVTTLATCWRLELQDSPQTIMGFTDHDIDIVFNGVTYLAASGYTASAYTGTSSLSVDNLDITGVLDSAGITEADILAKKYDNADVYIFAVNYKDDPITNDIKLSRGKIGNIEVRDNVYVAEFRSLAQLLQKNLTESYSIKCRVELGSTPCGVSLAGSPSYTFSGTVAGVTDRRQFTDATLTNADGYFDYGLLTWLTGNNAGYSMEVKEHDYTSSPLVAAFTLYEPMPYDIQINDTYSVYAGCDKTRATCKSKFNNLVNIRDEDFIPGIDEIQRFGGQ